MSGDPRPHQQSISHVSVQQGSRAYVGTFSNCRFGNNDESQKAPEQAVVACRNALFLTDPHVDRESVISAKGTRVAGTCEWIIQNASYRAWLNSDSDGSGDRDSNGDTRLLWISGGPGKGKTMLSVFLTEELEKYTARIDNAELAFFFCSAQDEKRNTAVAVLRGFVHQIIAKRPQLVKHALPYFEASERTQQTLSSLETLWLIFSKLIADAELGTMFCVLDGLDECEESTLRGLVPRLVKLLVGDTLSSARGAFKLVIVSRDIPGLQGCTRVRLDPDNDEKVIGDIELFVSARVGELSRIEGFDNDFRASVKTALLKGAEGTFLWVGFAMHELLQKQTCSEIWGALEDLPSGLPAIYSRMLLRIPAKQREICRVILRWVATAARPLQLEELAVAIDVRTTVPQITVEQAIRDAVTICGPLLKVREREVSLVHQSARDYLVREEHDSDVVLEAFRLNSESAHLELARKCLDCVAQSDLQHHAINFDAEPGCQDSPLLRYAALYWPEHAKGCSARAAHLFDPSGVFFQKKSSLRDHWWKMYDGMATQYRPVPLPLLHMACSLEIIPWVEAILSKRSWMPGYHKHVDKKDCIGDTALHSAAFGRNEAVVRLLVDSGADVNAKNNMKWTVLHSAASAGNEVVVRLLVKSGADVMVRDKDGQTVLHWAAIVGAEAVVRLLIYSGAKIEAKNYNGQTVLHWAASAFRESDGVVRLLLDSGADVQAKDSFGMTALHLSASRGIETRVRLLANGGADVNAKDDHKQTVLHWAALGRDEAVVKSLVDSGADVKAKDGNGETVLHWAARGGNQAVVRLLVDRGADVKAKDKYGKTVLHRAASRGNAAVVQLLIESGADVMVKDKDGQTVLHWAAFAGDEEAVQLLVDSGADVKAKDGNGETVLHWAARGGNQAVVRLLVDRGADVKVKDKKGSTVLHIAALGRDEAVVQLLVDSGADVNAKDSNGKTVLHWAASGGNKAILRLLVDT